MVIIAPSWNLHEPREGIIAPRDHSRSPGSRESRGREWQASPQWGRGSELKLVAHLREAQIYLRRKASSQLVCSGRGWGSMSPECKLYDCRTQVICVCVVASEGGGGGGGGIQVGWRE
jgi:hypothetical protein